MMKADMGPGQSNNEFQAIVGVHGFSFFAGLPNVTELGQEMSQLFFKNFVSNFGMLDMQFTSNNLPHTNVISLLSSLADK